MKTSGRQSIHALSKVSDWTDWTDVSILGTQKGGRPVICSKLHLEDDLGSAVYTLQTFNFSKT